VAALVLAPILQLLFDAYGLATIMPREGMDPSQALQAPQASLMSSVALGVLTRNLPWALVGIGALLAVIIIAIDEKVLAPRDGFRAPVLAVAVGIYLPIELSVPIFVGGLVAHIAQSALIAGGASANDQARIARNGLLFASGLITGEAMVGILLAVVFVAAQSTQVLAIDVPSWLPEILGIGVFAAMTAWTYSVARKQG
jgi:putative OPT family oligopeptide transporter